MSSVGSTLMQLPKLTLELMREALQSYIQRGYSWNKASNALMIEFSDITLLNEHWNEVQRQYEAKASFREASKTRYNKVAS